MSKSKNPINTHWKQTTSKWRQNSVVGHNTSNTKTSKKKKKLFICHLRFKKRVRKRQEQDYWFHSFMKSKQPSKFTIPVKLWDITESVQQAERACTIVQDGAEMLKATEQTSKLQQKQATTKTSFCHSTPPLFLSQKRNNFSFLMCNLRHKHDHLIKSNKKTSKQTKNTTQKKKKKEGGEKKHNHFLPAC